MILNLLLALLLGNNNHSTVLIDLSYYEHRKDDDGVQYHFKNWIKSTGFIYKDEDGIWILSAAHIIPYDSNHLVEGSTFASFNPELKHDPEKIEFVAYDRKIDISLFKFVDQESVKNLPYVKLGSSEDLEIGQEVLAIGHPWPIKFATTKGHINSVSFIGFAIHEDQPNFLVHSCMINSGSSGGPLFNLLNEVIGINVMNFERPNVFNLAVPIDDVKFLLPKLKKGGEIKHQKVGLIGFAHSFMLSDEDLIDLDIDPRPKIKGIIIIGVKEDSLPNIAGFQKGDIVISCNGKKPKDLVDFFKMVYLKAEPYEILKIEIDRYGQTIILPLLLFDPLEKEVEID